MPVDPVQLDQVMAHTRALLGSGWKPWPGGYPTAIELALIDAVFSIRARYGQPGNPATDREATGVRAVVHRWRDREGGEGNDDLSHILDVDAASFARILGNASRTSERLKSDAVQEAAAALVGAGICSSADLAADRQRAKAAYVSVSGLGWVTFSYLCMLLDIPDVKADTWILRFVRHATSAQVSTAEAYALLHAAARRFRELGDQSMPHNPAHLDHAIWAAQRIRVPAA